MSGQENSLVNSTTRTQAPTPQQDSRLDYSAGTAFVEECYVPIRKACLPLLDWGFLRSDATYDVVHVWKGRFFRLQDHLDRFERSVTKLRLTLPYARDDIGRILCHCVRLSGLRDAYVEMICTRGVRPLAAVIRANAAIDSLPLRSLSCGSSTPSASSVASTSRSAPWCVSRPSRWTPP